MQAKNRIFVRFIFTVWLAISVILLQRLNIEVFTCLNSYLLRKIHCYLTAAVIIYFSPHTIRLAGNFYAVSLKKRTSTIPKNGGAIMLKEKIKSFLAVCILIITIPYIITFFFQRNETLPGYEALRETDGENSISQENHSEDKAADPKEASPEETPSKQAAIDIEEYLIGIVATEISLDYEPEAIKAQAVIARTSLTAALDAGSSALPASMSREEMITLWGQDGFEENYQALVHAIQDTQGEILTYGGQPILAAFHAVSAGKTRDSKDASIENAPYLCSADTSLDIPSPDFLSVIFMEKKEFLRKLQEGCPAFDAEPEHIMEHFNIEARDGSGYVIQAKLDEAVMSGESLRECLGLNSSCFYIKEVEGQIRIVTRGLGHGLGLSQYAANEMAKEGKDYQEILSYFYKNTDLASQ